MQTLSNALLPQPPPAASIAQFRGSPARQAVSAYLRAALPGLNAGEVSLPQTTYSLYRQFALSGARDGYESPYFEKRAILTRLVVELILGDESRIDLLQDLLWSICEETSWVLPAHEERGPGFERPDRPAAWQGGTSTSLTREPDFIDLFAAETAASLAETLYFLEDRLAPEVVQRVRQEVERRIFRPYLAYGRKFWWHRGDLNWNAVCNGAVGLAFMRLEREPRRLAEALAIVLEGLNAYIETGFEPDGGSLEGIGYWNYGLLYYVTFAELLNERTGGEIDLLANPRLRDIARYPLAIALAPGKYFNFADAADEDMLQPGIVQRLAERTGVDDLAGLIIPYDTKVWRGFFASKLTIVLRDLAWWDGQIHPFPAAARQDAYLPACALVKLNGQTSQGQPVILAAKAGCNSGHHYHLDIGHFILSVDGENLLCDPGRGLYSRGYFGEQRFENIFANSFGHSVPRIGGHLQMPGPKFGQGSLERGRIISPGKVGARKSVVMDIHLVYGLPELMLARRTLELDEKTGELYLQDRFEFRGDPLAIEEAFVTWCLVAVNDSMARIIGERSELSLTIVEPVGAAFAATLLTEECRANQREKTLTRLAVGLPAGAQRFILQVIVHQRFEEDTFNV
ncbi:MAG TPA: heparinase II/III family protein [Anaerolineales bacterium]|nr:heparinase II/III family protein [Anaerolineales bacterium]